jgi:hypothetical protein
MQYFLIQRFVTSISYYEQFHCNTIDVIQAVQVVAFPF